MPCQPGESEGPKSPTPVMRASPTGTVTLPPKPNVSGDCCWARTKLALSSRAILRASGRCRRINALRMTSITTFGDVYRFVKPTGTGRRQKRELPRREAGQLVAPGPLQDLHGVEPDAEVDRYELRVAALDEH